MAEPFVGEIRVVGFPFAPVGWELCNGKLLLIDEYATLYTLIGTTYGGDGMQTFGLPNLQGRVPIHIGSGGGGTYPLGANGGSESVTLTAGQLASHNHSIAAQSNSSAGGLPVPTGNYFSASTQPQFGPLAQGSTTATLLTAIGGGQPHDNIQPYQCVNYIISLNGIFPSQT
jgi:microcystin-dependent protein